MTYEASKEQATITEIETEATHLSRLHLGALEQLHCFNVSIEKLTSMSQQVAASTKKKERERNRKKRHTCSQMKQALEK